MSELPPLPRALDGALEALRGAVLPAQPLFAEGVPECRLPGGPMLHADPQMALQGHWSSPRGRLIEIETEIHRPGRWLALHLPLPPLRLTGTGWVVLAAHVSASRATVIRAALRSGTAEGFRDDFFALDILAQSRQADHLDALAPARLPDLPPEAPWRELVLFLPPATGIRLCLHDLRLAAL